MVLIDYRRQIHISESKYKFSKSVVLKLGLTQWNLNSFEFKFDDTKLSS